MKILVTGIAGAIGSHVAERLLDLGHQVVGIDALTSYYSPEIKRINVKDVKKKGAEIYFKDLARDNVSSLIKAAEIVFHFAAQPGISAGTPFEDYLNNNIVATQKLLEATKDNKNLKAFIFISTSSVYGIRAKGSEKTEPKPTSYYGVTKLAAEQLALSYYRDKSVPIVCLRLFSVYGERERPEKLFYKLTKAILENKEFPLYAGSEYHVRSYTYVGDIVDGCLLVLENLNKCIGEIFNLGNDKTNTTGEGIKIIEKILGKKAKFKIIPKRAGDQVETSANIKKARKIFGYNPSVSLEEGLANQVKWYKEKIHGRIK